MQGQLAKVDGFKDVEIDFASKTAKVTVEKGTDSAAVAKALSGKYSGELKK